MKQDAAVSPVVGTVLMIVMTLIIVAVVSSFAGGMAETKDRAPVITLEAEYHQSGVFPPNGVLSLTHLAGDPIPLSQISLRLTPSQTFGIDAIKHSRALDKTKFKDKNGKNWGEITVMQVGDRHFIPETELDAGADLDYYKVGMSSSSGRTFYLEVYYDNTLIAKPEVLIRD